MKTNKCIKKRPSFNFDMNYELFTDIKEDIIIPYFKSMF